MAGSNVILRGIAQGKREGRAETKKEVLDLLETFYLSNDVERGSERGKIILEIASKISESIKG